MGMTVERVITVEHLEPSMSRELLCKFPDPSAFDFDYSQSGIWSPLIHRGHAVLLDSPSTKRRRIVQVSVKFFEEKLRRVDSKIRKRAKKIKGACSEFSVSPSQESTGRKGWGKMLLKAATRRFRKQKGSSLQLKH